MASATPSAAPDNTRVRAVVRYWGNTQHVFVLEFPLQQVLLQSFTPNLFNPRKKERSSV